MPETLRRPLVGLSLMLEADFAAAALPLFAEGQVDILEWSFDVLWNGAPGPDWLPSLLQEYASAGRLLGHGVSYSMFSANADARAREWCERLRQECRNASYQHISEHFGFMVAGDFHRGTPLPLPCTEEVLRIGHDRLQLLAEACGVPVGLENLAFAFCEADVREQGAFLDALLQPVDGFVLLDLHNIYCQSCNFGISAEELLRAYPLHRVRELHLSGGSWSEAEGATVRRDTHDGPVPDELFPLLEKALELCPNVRAVILEQLGSALNDERARERYRADFTRITEIVRR